MQPGKSYQISNPLDGCCRPRCKMWDNGVWVKEILHSTTGLDSKRRNFELVTQSGQRPQALQTTSVATKEILIYLLW